MHAARFAWQIHIRCQRSPGADSKACRQLQGVFTDVSVDLDSENADPKEVVKQAEEFITIESRLRSTMHLADPANFPGGLFKVQQMGKFQRQQIVYLKDLIGTERYWMPLGDLAQLATSILEHQVNIVCIASDPIALLIL